MDDFEMVKADQPMAIQGFEDNFNRRQELVGLLCNHLKQMLNYQIDQYCKELQNCVKDNRGFLSYFYTYNTIPLSEEEIIKRVQNSFEVPQESIEELVTSFHERCTSKLPFIQNNINLLQTNNAPPDEVDIAKALLAKIQETDLILIANLRNTATWRDVLVINEDGTESDHM
uniref:Uncharacterized protein n=1 Tax=viral metagenome TaxID=1070528 RepID=A0A6C0J573_9ZZZZ